MAELKRAPDIERFLKAPDAKIRAAVIHGRDLGMVRERAGVLAAAATERPDDTFDTALITEADLEAQPARLEEELAAVSMLGGRRLVRLRLSGERAGAERLATEALEAHLAGRLNAEAFLLIECGALRTDAPLRKAAAKAAGAVLIPCYEDEIGDLVRLTRTALAAEGLGLTNEAAELFAARLPHERGVARQEIERLILFLGPGSGMTAGPDDLVDFLGVEPETSLAEAARDAFGGRAGAAQAGLRRAAREGQSGVPVARALGAHLARLRRFGVAAAAGTPLTEVLKAAKVFFKEEREIARQVRAWSGAHIEAAQEEITAADIACRQTAAPDELIGERLALAVAARARRLGL